VRGKEQRAPKRLEQAAEPQQLRERGLRDAPAQPEVRPEQVPAAVLQASARDASPEAALGRRQGARAQPAETAVEPWAAAPEALLAVPPWAELPEAPWEASPMLRVAERRPDEQAAAESLVPEAERLGLPPLVPQAERLARVKARVSPRAQAVESTPRPGLVPERRSPVPQPARMAASLEAEPLELRPPEASPAA
jgi:hypothetical protein